MFSLLKSIKAKLLISFFLLIFLFVTSTVFLFFVYQNNIGEYKVRVEKLVLEYRLADIMPDYIDSYYSLVRVRGKSVERLQLYEKNKQEIIETIDLLNSHTFDEESKNVFEGITNIIASIIDDCEKGLDEIRNNSVQGATNYYTDANEKNVFINENVIQLTFKELEAIHSVEEDIEKSNLFFLIIGGMLVLLLIILSVAYSIIFSLRLSNAIKELDVLAKNISDGKLDTKVNKKLLRKNDEIGSLANTFSKMIKGIQRRIDELDRGNKEISDSQKKIEMKNDNLEKFNKLAVDRELKMVELKKKIEEYEEKKNDKK